MIPTPRFLIAFLAAAPLLALGGLTTPIGLAGLGWCVLVLALLAADNRLSLRAQRLQIERRVDRKLSLGAQNQVRLHLENLSRWNLRLTVKDDPPTEFLTPRRSSSTPRRRASAAGTPSATCTCAAARSWASASGRCAFPRRRR
jgi:hypothetical protein